MTAVDTVLQEIAARLSGAVSMRDVANVIVATAVPAVGAAIGTVHAPSGDGRRLLALAVTGLGDDAVKRVSELPSDGDSDVARVFRDGQVRPGAHAALPLRAAGRVIGVLSFGFPEGAAAPPVPRDFLETIAALSAQALDRARLFDEERATKERLRLLGHVSDLLGSSLDHETTLHNVIACVVPALGDFGFFDVVEPGGEVRRLARAHADPRREGILAPTRWQRSERKDLNLCALSSGEVGHHPYIDDAWYRDVAVNEGHLQVLRELAFQSMVTVPLRAHGALLGALTLFHVDGGRRHDDADVELAEEVADRAAAALENARLYRDLQEAIRRRDEADRRKDQFLAMLGHELRNPLAPALTALELMKLRGAGKLEREREVIERQIRHLVRLVDDLLDVARITQGKIRLHREPVDLGAVLARAVEVAGPTIEAKGHALTVDFPREKVRVDADELRLAQVFTNLLGNAAKYTEPGGSVRVRARREGDDAVVEIADTGKGIARDDLADVFELFFQAAPPGGGEGGLGLGLALVKSLTELHGGKVTAHSDGLGKGSRFVVRLPALPSAEADLDRSSPGIPAAAAVRAGGERVLVVDDNVDAAVVLGELLRAYGHEVAIAHDAEEALDKARGFAPTTALLDLGLPTVDGYELARLLRAERQDIRLIAMTGFGHPSARERSRAAGFELHLVKPVDVDAVLAAITTRPR